MSEWILIDADLGSYSSTKFKSGGRLYFIKAGRKNVSIYDLALRKNVSLKLSTLPKFFYTPENFTFETHHFSTKTWKSILKNFRVYQKNKTRKRYIRYTKNKNKL
tara:strand:- start:878 stop:1192 length:315 start_codon:yes stop_codon:yes gene_type:complete